MVALSMADGYARLTGKPQCVIVHVDVGTQGLGAAVHNASCGRAPVLIFAGLSPFTIEGEMRGSRTEYIHWIQDVPDQKQIVAQYCRYTGEIKSGRNVKVRPISLYSRLEADNSSKWSTVPSPLQ
jgi:thiamine pyrophosphate-dependent acetolactate synthase large subunit-like protein